MLKMTLMLFSVLTAFAVSAEMPEYYQVLSRKIPALESRIPAWKTMASPWKPDKQEQEAGFAWHIEGIGTNPRPDYLWQTIRPRSVIRQFLKPGEIRSTWLVVHMLKATDNLQIEADTLYGPNGNKIAPENFFFQRVYYAMERTKWNELSCFLVADSPWKAEKGESFWIWTNLYAPADTPAGVYRGTFKIHASGSSRAVPVELAVLDGGNFTQSIPWGPFMPGHYEMQSEGCYRNFAPGWWKPENLDHWVRLWKSRGSESPFLYHIYADIEMKDGRIQLKTPFLDDIIQSMTKYGMKGPLLLDIRHLTWWSHAAAVEIQQKGLSPEAATLSVRGPGGFSISGAKEQYSQLDKDIFRKVIREFFAQVRDCGIPIIFIAEEEIGYHNINGFFNVKTVGYDTFNPILMEEVGRDRVGLVDNGLYTGGIDRGERDGLRYRSHNNWTQKALESVKNDLAEVWMYNGGWSRNIANYLMRIKARAYHQWADGWWHPGYGYWLASAVNPDGGIPSIELERLAAGMRDYEYFRLLDIYAEKAEKGGFADIAKALRQIRIELFDNLPLNKISFEQEYSFSDDDLDRRRWECVMAASRAQKALGEKPLWDFPADSGQKGHPEFSVSPILSFRKKEGRQAMAIKTAEPIVLDGEGNEAIWKMSDNTASNFQWTALKEEQMRAAASSKEEFERMGGPSGSFARIAYDDNGLYLLISGNHLTPDSARKKDDDPEIWSDDVFEFFWKASIKAPEWQLLVNTKGSHTLLCNKQIVKNSGVKIAVKSPINKSGGVSHEIYIPWETLGGSIPKIGDIWQFNICRNFNSWKQLSSWAQMPGNSFGLSDGQLIFGSEGARGLKISGMPQEIGPGHSTLKLSWKETPDLTVGIFDQDGNKIYSIPTGRDGVTLDLNLPYRNKTGRWLLKLTDQSGKEIASQPFLVLGPPVLFLEQQSSSGVIAGQPWFMVVSARIGNGSAKEEPVRFLLKSKSGNLEFPAPLAQERNRFSLETDTLVPGKYDVELSIKGIPETIKTSFEVLPGPF